MRGRAGLSVVVALGALAAAVVGCTDDGDDDAAPRSTSTEEPGDPTQVPRAFVSGADGGWGVVGATDDVLVGLGGKAADDERFGQTFDLETGALADIPPPPFEEGREVEVERAAFGSSDFSARRGVSAYSTGSASRVQVRSAGSSR